MTDEQVTMPDQPIAALPAIVTTKELAGILRVSPTQIRRMNLPAIEVGRGRWRYVTSQVLDELRRRAQHGGLTVKRRTA